MSFDPTYPHKLDPLPPKKTIANTDFGDLLINARVELAELKGACGQIPNPLLLMSPSIIRESVASSNIENINTTLADVLQWSYFLKRNNVSPTRKYCGIVGPWNGDLKTRKNMRCLRGSSREFRRALFLKGMVNFGGNKTRSQTLPVVKACIHRLSRATSPT